MEKNGQNVHICMITDEGYVMPTCVALQSVIQNKKAGNYCIHIISSNLSADAEAEFRKFENTDIHIYIVKENAIERFKGFHTFDDSAICVASLAALLKFTIPELFPDLDKILYLDGDLVVKTDLNELYSCDIEEYYAAAVIDSGSIYFKHAYVKMVQHYFNSGVMLLNLKKMRQDNICQKLLQTKKDLQDSSLMDQNVFNLVFDKKVCFLPIRYNFMPVSLERSYAKWTINQINDLYVTNYQNKKQLFSDAVIIHYSSKDKPWMNLDGALSSEWISYYLNAPIEHPLVTLPARREPFGISVIMPCYNTEQYVRQTLDSILAQTFKDFEIICLDDGSTDGTLAILREYEAVHANIRVFANKNFHQGWERNLGIRNATGKYIYFMDSDDLLDPKCFEVIYQCAEINNLDLLYFEGKSFFENLEIEDKFPQYKTLYNRKEAFPKVYNGKELFIKFRNIGGLIVSPCLQLVRKEYILDNDVRFPEIPLYEDNLYTFFTLTRANRVKCISDVLFFRRVRHGSTMTFVNSEESHKSFQFICIELLKELLKNDKGSPMYLAIKKFMAYFVKEWRKGLPDIDKQKIEYDKLLAENNERGLYAFYINETENNSIDSYLDNRVVHYGKGQLSARIDVKLFGDTADFELQNISDNKAMIAIPGWFQNGGKGYHIETLSEDLNLSFIVKTDGKLTIYLRGRDVHGDDGKRLPYWINYNMLTYNGIMEFKEAKYAWHDKPITISHEVKAGETVNLHIEWKPCKMQDPELPKRLKDTEKKLKASLSREASLKNSVSFRTGRAITWFPRKVRGGVRCLKEHGPAYTVKRLFWHITH